MEFKNIVATIYLKEWYRQYKRSDRPDISPADVFKKAKMYNDCGIDKIYYF